MNDTAANAALKALVQEAQASGTLAGLPDKHLIAGQWRASAAGARMQSFDPGTGQAFAVFAAGDAQDVDLAVASARTALTGPWKDATPAQRGQVLGRVAQLSLIHI